MAHFFCENEVWLGAESNRRHEDFQSSALPTELPSRFALGLAMMFLSAELLCAGRRRNKYCSGRLGLISANLGLQTL
jgi:hypothetical protein